VRKWRAATGDGGDMEEFHYVSGGRSGQWHWENGCERKGGEMKNRRKCEQG